MTKDHFDILEETELHFQSGYRAKSIEDCPHPKASQGPYVLWMQGFHQHQQDRERVAQLVADPYCRSALQFRRGL